MVIIKKNQGMLNEKIKEKIQELKGEKFSEIKFLTDVIREGNSLRLSETLDIIKVLAIGLNTSKRDLASTIANNLLEIKAKELVMNELRQKSSNRAKYAAASSAPVKDIMYPNVVLGEDGLPEDWDSLGEEAWQYFYAKKQQIMDNPAILTADLPAKVAESTNGTEMEECSRYYTIDDF